MIAFLLTLLMAQLVPALPAQGGTVTGVLRASTGIPAAGIRVLVMVPPDLVTDAQSASAFVTLAETDLEGRYRLEDIPPGRYYVVAGRVDQPTYFPGTTDVSKARIFSITAGGAVSGIDFALMDSSFRSSSPMDNFLGYAASLAKAMPTLATITIPVSVKVAGGGKLPVFDGENVTAVRLINTVNNAEKALGLKDSFAFDMGIPVNSAPPEYRVRVENLPAGYMVKSMTYGADDVTTSALKFPAANLPRTAVMTVAGITQQVVTTVAPSGVPAPSLTITLATVPLPASAGVRVTGHAKDSNVRYVYLSGTAGILYSDGSFEFRGVAPGRYLVAALGNPPSLTSLGARIDVGDRDIDGVELQETPALPTDVKQLSAPVPAAVQRSRSALPLLTLHGRLTEDASGMPIEEGNVKLIGLDQAVVAVGTGGLFEFPKLLPGNYTIEIHIFGHANIQQPVIIGEEDVHLDVTTLRLY